MTPLFAHVSVGVPDLRSATEFYDRVFAAIGVPKLFEDLDHVAYGSRESYFVVMVRTGARPAAGAHVCFNVSEPIQVDAFWNAAIAAGGRDDGAPGLRTHYAPDYYAAFVSDPFDNRLEVLARVRRSD